MLQFLLSRLAQGVATVWAVTLVVFMSARITGSPEFAMLSPDASPAAFEAFRRTYGLDRSIPEQYLIWISHVLRGDLGTGIRFHVPVSELIAQRLVYSADLAAISIVVSIVIAIPLGVVAATHRGTAVDKVSTAVAVLGQAMPSFFLGMVLILMFSLRLRLLPATGAASWLSFILPSLTIGAFISAGSMRLVRSGMLEALDSEYVKFARLKGMPERVVVWKHALRNALIPVTTFLGYMFGAVIAASIAVETVFNWPGVGSLLFDSIRTRDFPVTQGVVLVWASIVVLANLSMDVLAMFLDPRIRIR